jgi:hypothetical protein
MAIVCPGCKQTPTPGEFYPNHGNSWYQSGNSRMGLERDVVLSVRFASSVA